jgi:hypothetical protein
MNGTAMRGTAGPAGGGDQLTHEGLRRNLGDSISPVAAEAAASRDGKSRRRSRCGEGNESDDCVGPVKPRTRPVDGLVAEMVEERRPAGGTVRRNACPGHSARSGVSPRRRADGSKPAWATQAPSFDRV